MSEAVSQTLLWVHEELASTLSQARRALEGYIDRPENTTVLKSCADLMHEAAGALRMVEVQGGALLAEEVEQVARRLLDAPSDQQTRSEALEALSRAMVQLPTYMERVVNGGRDIPLILLPLLNDLRAVRGEALLSENTLLLLNLPAERRPEPQHPPARQPSGADARSLARQSRPRFQAALLGWIRGDRPDSSLAVMADVVGELEEASTVDRCYQLWWIAGGVIEALRQGGLEANAALKRILGQVDFQVRRLGDESEGVFESAPPVALLNSLLFYVARSTTRGRRVVAIRECFKLGDLVPPEDELEHARDSLAAPSVRLMQTVGGAIRDDLARVKDVLDIFVRTGMSQLDELASQVDLLRKIGDTLGVLGLPGMQAVVHDEAVALKALVDGERTPDEDTLLGTAAHLLEVEDNIERQLVGMIAEEHRGPADGEDLEALEARRDFGEVTATVLRECNVNLGRVKEAIVQALEAPLEPQVLDEVPSLLRAITAGLLMLDRTRAVALVERIGGQIRHWLSIGERAPSDEALDRLADAVVSLEYYMETIASGRSDPMYMLDNADACLAALDGMTRERRPMPEPAPAAVAATMVIPPPFPQAAPAAPVGEAVDEAAPRVGPEPGAVDPELLELFIEEAGELAVEMGRLLSGWQETPPDEAATADLRRAFHTLKGSGRMVGAELIGRVAWSVENLLNRVIAGQVERSEAIAAFVAEAVAQVPELVEQLETGRPPAGDPARLIAHAEAFAEGRTPAPPAGEEMDPVLRDIFTKEAGEHLATIRRYLTDRRERAAPHPITDDLYRACHTLAGSANMAGVASAVSLARPLDRLVRSLHDEGTGMSGTLLDLCEAAADLCGQIIDAVSAGHSPTIDVAGVAEALVREHAEHAQSAEGAAADARPRIDEAPGAGAAEALDAGAAPGLLPDGQPAAASAPPLELDPEIAAIFREEADEILERCDEVLERWRADVRAREPLEELQRQLHTLKGGARLASLQAMGDLSHALEDLTTRLLREPAKGPDYELVRRAIDELHRMREGIDAGLAVPAPAPLLSALAGEVPAAPAEGAPDVVLGEAADDAVPVLDFDLTGAQDDAPAPPAFVPVPAAGGEGAPGAVAASTAPDGPAYVPVRPWQFGPPPAAAPQLRAPDWPPAAPGPGEAMTPAAAEPPELADIAASAPAESLEPGEPIAPVEPVELVEPIELPEPVELGDGPWPEAAEAGAQPEPTAAADEPEEAHGPLEPALAVGPTVPDAAWVGGAAEDARPVPEDGFEELEELEELEEAPTGELEPTLVLEPAAALDATSADDLREVAETAEATEADEPDEQPEEEPEALEPTMVIEPTVVLEPPAPRTGWPGQEAPPATAPEPLPAPIEIPAAAAPGLTPAMPDIAAASPALGGRAEMVRVDADLLESLLNNAGEVSIYRSRLAQQVGTVEFNLIELSQTVVRLREQLRKLEMETEAQIRHGQPAAAPQRGGFDALEMDRYSVIQQLTRGLAETASDVSSLQQLLSDLTRDADTLLTQQQRVISELQDGLMSTRMVPFSRHVQRLNRIVRQAAREAGKQAELAVTGGENELDRQVMDRMLGPFEHLLRNAIVHGIEAPALREERGKSPTGRIGIALRRDGAEMSIVVSDDGAGLDVDAIRAKAEALGFIEPGTTIDDATAAELIFRPGFSTAIELTLAAGRGVGMDVVANEIRELGGSLRVESDPGRGLSFVLRLPFTRAITQALIMRAGEELFALPLPTVEGVARVRARDLGRHLGDDAEPFEYGGQPYRLRHLAALVAGQARPLPADDSYVPVVLVRAGEHSTAILGDEMLGAREIVVKSLGPQLAGVNGVAGATILGDGSIVVILDVAALVRSQPVMAEDYPEHAAADARDGRTFVMVVDDSITVRRVTERLLERNGMRVMTAKDGVDAVSLLREHRPDVILLDIEMPRMDGYEVANHVRNDPRLQEIPIVMITSRVGRKHRARAIEAGVDDYLGKPYQENQLLAAIGALVGERRQAGEAR